MSSSIEITELTDVNTCKLCENAIGKYTCPKCSILYCSLGCYQSQTHLECSERFYQDCVTENFPKEATAESRAKMLEILQRTHDEQKEELDSDDEDEEEDEIDLSERLAGVNLDDTERVWEKLNERERKDFEQFLKSEDVSKLIKPWEPWWTYRCDDRVLDMDKFDEVKDRCPKIRKVKDFFEISKKPASDVIQYNLINIIASYVFTSRYFNGENNEFKQEAVACISKVSLNLSKSSNFNTFDEAVQSVQNECINMDWLQTDAENMKLMRDDVWAVTQGPHSTERKFYISCCLSDLYDLFTAALKDQNEHRKDEFSKAFPQSILPEMKRESRESMRRSLRKFEFMLSFVKDVLYAE